MLKVGDFSRLGHVTVRTLRLYDDLGLLKPARVDLQSGYRYYSLEQLPLLNRILALKELGLELEQVRSILDRPLSNETVQGMLRLKQAELEQQRERTQGQLDRLALRLRQMEQEGRPEPLPDVHIKSLPPLTVASIRKIVPKVEEVGLYCYAHFSLLGQWFNKGGLNLGRTLNLYHVDEYRDEEIDMESAAVLEQPLGTTPPPDVTMRTLEPVPRAAVLTLETRMVELPLAITSLLSWVSQSGFSPVGPLREVHHFGDPSRICGTDLVVLELQLPVEQRPGS